MFRHRHRRNEGSTWWKVRPPRAFRASQGEVVHSDALVFLASLREGTADIVFLDPPFNLGKRYGSDKGEADRLADEDYFRYMCQVLDRSASILRRGGALYLYHLPRWAFRFANALQDRQLTFRHWIAISMKNGFPRGKHLYPAHYALLYFTKGEPKHFKRPKIETPRCRHCNRYLKDYGGYESFVRRGINLSDMWEDVSPVRHKKYKHREPNELPILIPERAIEISGRPGGLLVDPFAGSGTSLVAAVRKGMHFVACDSQLAYCRLMLNRVATLAGSHR